MTGQKRLKNAKVLVVGAGGLGSPALLYLAAAGVGTLGIVEFDEVDESNLQRQVIHGQSDIGRPKARVGPRLDPRDQPVRRGATCTRCGWTRRTCWTSSATTTSSSTAPTTSPPATWSTTPRCCSASPTCGARSSASRARRRCSGRTRPNGKGLQLPRPLPRAAAARHGAVVRRGRRAGRALRVDRLDHGDRGDQADHRHRRAAAGPADGLRRAGDELPHDQDPQGPGRPSRSPS